MVTYEHMLLWVSNHLFSERVLEWCRVETKDWEKSSALAEWELRKKGKQALMKADLKHFWPVFKVSVPKGAGIMFYCRMTVTRVGGLGKENLERTRDVVSSQPG